MERHNARFLAQEAHGRRVIVCSRCRHRQPCSEATWYAGERVHIDGLVFADETAALAFDRRGLIGSGQIWRTFRSWEEARAWLREES